VPARIYTLEDLRALDIERRRNLYLNAKSRSGGEYIVKLIDENGLPLSSGGLTADDPVYLEIVETAWSSEGRKAAVQATEDGYPAVAAIDRMLQKKLGDRYGKHDQGTVAAGAVVGEVMRHLGYKKLPAKACPSDCVAKTGAMWGER
jgi:hypothetical protein